MKEQTRRNWVDTLICLAWVLIALVNSIPYNDQSIFIWLITSNFVVVVYLHNRSVKLIDEYHEFVDDLTYGYRDYMLDTGHRPAQGLKGKKTR